MALRSLGKKEDVAASKKAVERDERLTLKIPDSKTPWFLFGLEYSEGFVHWWDINGQKGRTVCAGGMKGRGYDTDGCKLCKHVAAMYQEAKDLENDGKDTAAKKIRDAANQMRGRASFDFKAIRGMRMLMKTGAGQKKFVADWDTTDSESTAEAGILSLSSAQYEGLVAMIDDNENFPQITEPEDLINRVLWTSKETRKGKVSNYSAVVWSADKEESEFPEFDIPDNVAEYDLEEAFEIDLEDIDKVYAKATGEESEKVEEDEAVEYEDDAEDEYEETDEEAEAPTEKFLDDVEEDEDTAIEEDLDAADEEADRSFDDDIPEDPLPKKRTRPSVAPVKKKASVKKAPVKSGKRKM